MLRWVSRCAGLLGRSPSVRGTVLSRKVQILDVVQYVVRWSMEVRSWGRPGASGQIFLQGRILYSSDGCVPLGSVRVGPLLLSLILSQVRSSRGIFPRASRTVRGGEEPVVRVITILITIPIFILSVREVGQIWWNGRWRLHPSAGAGHWSAWWWLRLSAHSHGAWYLYGA